MNVAIDILDDIEQVLAAQSGGLSLAVLWESEAFLKRAGAFHDYTAEDLERDIAAIPNASQ